MVSDDDVTRVDQFAARSDFKRPCISSVGRLISNSLAIPRMDRPLRFAFLLPSTASFGETSAFLGGADAAWGV